jgi:hypothetical protein
MSYTSGLGATQTQGDYDGRISNDIRRALADQPIEISRGVKAVSDLPAIPDRGISQQPRSNR